MKEFEENFEIIFKEIQAYWDTLTLEERELPDCRKQDWPKTHEVYSKLLSRDWGKLLRAIEKRQKNGMGEARLLFWVDEYKIPGKEVFLNDKLDEIWYSSKLKNYTCSGNYLHSREDMIAWLNKNAIGWIPKDLKDLK